MFYEVDKARVIKARAFKFDNNKGGLALMRVDYLDDRSTPDVINGFGMTVPESEAKELAKSFPTRNEDGLFYKLLVEVIDY